MTSEAFAPGKESVAADSTGTAAAKRVFILGSCVSRDALAAAPSSSTFVLVSYLARSSLATLASPPAEVGPSVETIRSEFQKRMVKADHRREALRVAAAGDYDLMLIDLIDERFNLLRRADGTIVTLSNEYAAVAQRLGQGTQIKSGSEHHVKLWRIGLARLVSVLRERNALSKVRINRVFWAERDVEGRPIPGFTLEQTAQANAFLAARYRDLESVFGADSFVRYEAEALVSDPGHKWGVSAFHYVPRLYMDTLRQLGDPKASSCTESSTMETARPSQQSAARTASIEAGPMGLTVTVHGEAAPGSEFAYYLLRDQQRASAIWYSPRTQVSFPCPSVSGEYFVTVFERQRSTGRTNRYRTPSLKLPDARVFSIQKWSRQVRSYDPAKRMEPVDGVHRFIDTGPSSLDFLLQGFADAKPGTPVIVCFSGAVSARDTKVGPFFSGLSIGKAANLPMVAVADPTLTRAANVALGWYAGNDQSPALSKEIAVRLDELASAWQGPLILIGGSGGGFASLATLCALDADASAIVWNPQTSIAKYHIPSVHRYVIAAFPEAARKHGLHKVSAARAERGRLTECLDHAGVLHDLSRISPARRKPALYLQNESDEHHVVQHMQPLLMARGASWSTPRLATEPSGMSICLGNWGKGHIPPTPETIVQLIQRVAHGTSPLALAEEIATARFKIQERLTPGT